MYIIYLYLLFNVQKILPQRSRRMYFTTLLLVVSCQLLGLRPHRVASSGRTDMCYDLIVSCQLLVVRIAPAQGCLVGGEQTCVTTLLLVVSCQLLGLRPHSVASSGRTDMCYDLIVSCQLLVVRIAPAQGCLVGASRHVLRPYCYLLFVICYDCARTGLPRRANRHVLRPYCQLLVVRIVPAAQGKMSALVEGEKCFTVICESTTIAGRLHCNRPAIPYQSSVSMFHAA